MASPPRDVYPPEIWALESLMVLQNTHVAANLVHRNFESEVAQYGDTIHTRKPSKFTVNDMAYSEDATLAPQTAQATNVTITLDKHREVSWRLTDRDMATSIKNLVSEFMEPAIIPMAEKIDGDLLGIDGGLCDNSFARVTASSASALAIGDFAAVRAKMRSQQVPLRGANGQPSVSGVLGVDHEQQILTVTEFVQANTFGKNPPALATGFLTQVYGMALYADQTVPSISAADSDGVDDQSPFFHRNALAYVSRPLEQPPSDLGVRSAVVSRDGTGLRVVMSYDHLRLGWLISIDILYGFKILDTSLGCVLSD